MNDFLGSLKEKDGNNFKDKRRRDRENKRSARSHSKHSFQIQMIVSEILPVVQGFLQGIIDNQKRALEIEESRIKAYAAKIPEKKKYTKTPLTEKRKRVLKLVKDMRSEGFTYGKIADHLKEMKIPTFSGRGTWHAQTIHRLL